MKQLTGILILLLLSACAPAEPVARALSDSSASMPLTATIIPSASPGYAATIAAAQGTTQAAINLSIDARETSAAAMAQLVAATNDAEARAQEYVRMTAAVEAQTATAAPTTFPLTLTGQVIKNSQVNTQAALIASGMTATHEAPTQIVAVARAEAQKKYAPFNALADSLSKSLLSLAGGCVGLAMLLALLRRPAALQDAPSDADEPVIVHQFNQGPQVAFQRYPPITDTERETICLAINNGAKLTFRDLTPDYFSDPRWREIRVRLTNPGPDGSAYATVRGDGTLELTHAGSVYLGVPPLPQV